MWALTLWYFPVHVVIFMQKIVDAEGSGQWTSEGENPLRAQKATVLTGVPGPQGLPPAETGW